jgi:hypothetical protein
VRNGSVIAVGVFAVSVACAPDDERPPPPLPCSGCGTPNIGISSGSLPPSGGGSAGTGGAGSDEPVRLEGEVRILTDIAGLTSTRFDDAAAVLAEGTSGDVAGTWSGFEPIFSIDGVKRAQTAWTQVTPGPGDALRTLAPVDTSFPNDAGVVTTALTLATASEIDAIYGSLVSPIERSDLAGQAILVALNGGAPASGVEVLAPAAEAVLYVENGIFSDEATATDRSGLFILANVPAGGWPGSTIVVTLGGSAAGRYDLVVVSGGVTLAGVGN